MPARSLAFTKRGHLRNCRAAPRRGFARSFFSQRLAVTRHPAPSLTLNFLRGPSFVDFGRQGRQIATSCKLRRPRPGERSRHATLPRRESSVPHRGNSRRGLTRSESSEALFGVSTPGSELEISCPSDGMNAHGYLALRALRVRHFHTNASTPVGSRAPHPCHRAESLTRRRGIAARPSQRTAQRAALQPGPLRLSSPNGHLHLHCARGRSRQKDGAGPRRNPAWRSRPWSRPSRHPLRRQKASEANPRRGCRARLLRRENLDCGPIFTSTTASALLAPGAFQPYRTCRATAANHHSL